METLGSIEKNLTKVDRIIGRSQTTNKLPLVKNKNKYRNTQGKKVTLGEGQFKVTAKNQK